MADIKVSQLPAYNSILSGLNDALLIVDSTNSASKKISPQALVGAFLLAGAVDPSVTPVVTPAIYLNTQTRTTWIFNPVTNLWVQITGGSGGGVYQVPYVSFVSAQTGSINQTFTSPSFAYYTSASTMTVLVNGVAITPASSYTLSGTTLTITDFLSSESLVEVIAKTVPLTQVEIEMTKIIEPMIPLKPDIGKPDTGKPPL